MLLKLAEKLRHNSAEDSVSFKVQKNLRRQLARDPGFHQAYRTVYRPQGLLTWRLLGLPLSTPHCSELTDRETWRRCVPILSSREVSIEEVYGGLVVGYAVLPLVDAVSLVGEDELFMALVLGLQEGLDLVRVLFGDVGVYGALNDEDRSPDVLHEVHGASVVVQLGFLVRVTHHLQAVLLQVRPGGAKIGHEVGHATHGDGGGEPIRCLR